MQGALWLCETAGGLRALPGRRRSVLTFWCIPTSNGGKGMWWQRWEQGLKGGTSLARRKTRSRHLGLSARHFQFPSICQTEIVGGHVKPSKAESQQNKINSHIHGHKSISIFIIGPYRSLYIMGQVAWASTNFFPGYGSVLLLEISIQKDAYFVPNQESQVSLCLAQIFIIC